MNEQIDITAFDSVADAEQPVRKNMMNPDGVTPSGVVLHILGENADAVTRWVNQIVNRSIKERAIAQRKGKMPDPLSIEEQTEQNIEGCCVRVTGWGDADHPIQQPFDRALLKNALRRNPHWVTQILAESANAGNFSTPQQAS